MLIEFLGIAVFFRPKDLTHYDSPFNLPFPT